MANNIHLQKNLFLQVLLHLYLLQRKKGRNIRSHISSHYYLWLSILKRRQIHYFPTLRTHRLAQGKQFFLLHCSKTDHHKFLFLRFVLIPFYHKIPLYGSILLHLLIQSTNDRRFFSTIRRKSDLNLYGRLF